MNARPSSNPTAVLVTRLTRVIALIAVLLPITTYWAFSYLEVSTQLEHELKIQALVMDDFIAAQPEGWDVSTDRVLGVLDRFLSGENGFGVFSAKGGGSRPDRAQTSRLFHQTVTCDP